MNEPTLARSGDISRTMGREVRSLAALRAKLIAKGMIWSPGHGDTAFTRYSPALRGAIRPGSSTSTPTNPHPGYTHTPTENPCEIKG